MVKIQYYRFLASTPNFWHYVAANSRNAALQFALLTSTAGDLEKITDEEASKAPRFEEFARTRKLCSDGTYPLGVVWMQQK